MAKSDDVILVTKDKAFFDKREYKNGLAATLLHEAKSQGCNISIYSSLTELIKDIKSDVPVNEEKLLDAIHKETYEKLKSLADRNDFYLKDITSKKFELYATTDPNEVSVVFCLRYDLEDYKPDSRINPYAESRGEFVLNISTYNIKNFFNKGELSVFYSWEAGGGEGL